MGVDDVDETLFNMRPDGGPGLRSGSRSGDIAAPRLTSRPIAQRGHVVDRDLDAQIPRLMGGRADDGGRLARADPPRNVLDWADGGGEPDALGRRSEQGVEPLEGEGEMGATLRAGDRVHLVEDDRVDAAERLAARRGEKQEERLGCRDEDVCGSLREPGALGSRGIARSRGDGDLGDLDTESPGLLRDPRERAPQVSVDIDGEGFQG